MSTPTFERYGYLWPVGTDDLAIELWAIAQGGRWRNPLGVDCGLGLFHHFKAAMTAAWPQDDHHRWSDLILTNLLANRITAITGSRDSSKTRTVSKWALIDYWAFQNETLTLMTSTNIRGLELRVWGDIKSLHERALELHPYLPGNVADSKHGVFTDSLAEGDQVRDMRKGILCVPCLGSQGEYMGDALKDFCGIKQKRRRLIGDELQFIPSEYLKVLDSLDKGDFKMAGLGNPIADNGKALDKLSEPLGGWSAMADPVKTSVWQNKYNGVTINLVGIDSPNFDAETLNKYPYMVDQSDVDRVSKRPGGKDSIEWWSQIMGVRKSGAISNRVLTVSEIERYGGFESCIWMNNEKTRVYSIDAGFGGDPCVRTWLDFGKNLEGEQIIQFGEQLVIPIVLSSGVSPEKQIARFAKQDCQQLGVPTANVFFDAGMYATLAVEMARELSPQVNAINFGGTATQRPVSADMFLFDDKTKERRHKTWYEHVSKFVTELWFVVRLLAQCRQARKFPLQAAEEFGRREWRYVYNDRYELESKDDYKLRNSGESPNFADSLVIGVEGARRLGFEIKTLRHNEDESDDDDFFESEAREYREAIENRLLVHR